MGSITGNLTSENQLHPAAQEVLLDAFSAGWADSEKLHRTSRHLAHLLEAARETFSTHLHISSAVISFLGEPSLGFHLGINGFPDGGRTFLPATSRKELFAATTARHPNLIPVTLNGEWEVPVGAPGDLLALSNVNVETGALSPDISNFQGFTFIDATATPTVAIPENWSSALWDSSSWRGPRGLGVFGLKDLKSWSYPLPHIDTRIVPGGVNPALVVASAIALDATIVQSKTNFDRIARINLKIREFIVSEIGDVDIASPVDASIDRLSFSFLYIQAEQLVEEMERRGFTMDSGSACVSANLEPSHVLTAMGRLTHGNIRIHLYPDLSDESVDIFLRHLNESVKSQRSQQ